MCEKGLTFRFGDMLVDIGMPDSLATQLTGGDAERLRHSFEIYKLSISCDGFHYVIAPGDEAPLIEVVHKPHFFGMFLDECVTAGAARADIFGLDTAKAIEVLKFWHVWVVKREAEQFERSIRAGKMTFEDARKERPQVFDVPDFARFFAASFKRDEMPKAKRGKRRSFSREQYELYGLASRIYRTTPGLTFEAACFAATEQRPDLVPDTWRSDPDGNLKREAARYWDKSKYSQLSYRQRRDG